MREITDENYLEELFINEATPALENAGGGAVDLEPIAAAITNKGVATDVNADVDIMAENIGKIVTGKCISLGNGTSFNVKNVCAQNGIDYTKLTNSNFIVGVSSISSSANTSIGQYIANSAYKVYPYASGTSISRSYNASTGVLSVSGDSQTLKVKYVGISEANQNLSTTAQGMTCFAYLFYAG